MIDELAHFLPNPAYGSGVYRRRIAFTAMPNAIVAQVDDTHHSFWLAIDHDAAQVTAIAAGFNRAPTDMCPGSISGLQALVGCSVTASTAQLLANLPRSSNCTHLVDLALWAIAHVDRTAVWTIDVPDQAGSPVAITIARDGAVVHRWQVADFHIVAPAHFAGKPLMAGFMKWAADIFADDTLLGAIMLQRGLFVARGRQYIVDEDEPVPLARAAGMAGRCWAYSEERFLNGKGVIGYVRDFTRSLQPETLPPHIDRRIKDLKS